MVVKVLAEVLEASSDTLRDYEEALAGQQLRVFEIQPLQLFLIEDILSSEFKFEFEDFKMTIMHHRLLDDQIIVGQIGDAFMQTQEYF